jgi:hypothetical protein
VSGSTYDLYDFTESLNIAGVPKGRIEYCSFAFGDSPEGWGSWHGGFVCHTRTGSPWLFVFGWCDTTGWGCQDGAWAVEFQEEPDKDAIIVAWKDQMYGDPPLEDGDHAPIDINRYLRGEITDESRVES